jgi:hypothetical protein
MPRASRMRALDSGSAQTIDFLEIWQQNESYPRFSPVEL